MKFLYTSLFLILIKDFKVQGRLVTDLISSGGTIIEGLAQEIPNIIPTPEEFFQLSIQVLIGYPEIAIAGLINQICKLISL